MTEIGPVAIEEQEHPGTMRVLEDDFYCEVVEPNGTAPVSEGEIGELIVTNLGRLGSPLIRYRTGDLVKVSRRAGILRFEGGILGRTDDMIHLRGNNVYPATIEAVVRKFPEVVEFRLLVNQSEALADLRMEVEPTPDSDGRTLAEAVAKAIKDELLFRVEVTPVPVGSLPRFEMKARRIHKI
jgi:phenylacetate-CoA ligase